MDATLARLLRAAAEGAARPGFEILHYRILPGLLRLEGRVRGHDDEEGAAGMTGGTGGPGTSPARVRGATSRQGLMRERARILAMRKEAESVGSSVSAFAFAMAQAPAAGAGKGGTPVSAEAREAAAECVALCDAHLKSLNARIESVLEEFARRAESEGPAYGFEEGGESPAGGLGAKADSGAAEGAARGPRPKDSSGTAGAGANKDASRPRGGSSLRGGGFGKPAAEGKPRVSASEQLRKRDEKKKKREERKTLFESFDAMRDGDGGGAASSEGDETAALVEDVLAQAGRFKEGSLPWSAKLIGVPVTADRDRARAQYRQRARLFHPDVCRHPRGPEAFVLLQRAWEVFESHAQAEGTK